MSEIDWSKAPEGATHYDLESELFVSNDSIWVNGEENDRSKRAILSNFGRYIPRPTKQEWEGGLPSDGELVVVADEEESPGVYFLCEFQADGPRFQKHPKGGCFYPDEIYSWNRTCIRLKSQQERQREEFINHCVVTIGCSASHEQVASHMYDIIVANYNLEPKP